MSELQTYILYYFIIFFTTILVAISGRISVGKFRNIGKCLFWFAVILPVMISGFRYGIGVDYFNYSDIYYSLTSNNNILDDILNTRYEPGWILLNHVVKLVFNDVTYVFIISSLIIWVCNFKAIYDNKNWIRLGTGMLILLTTLYNPSFNIIRISVGASIIMLAVKPIIDKKPLKFIFMVLIAACFHYTALIFLPVYWVVNSSSNNIGLIKRVITLISAVLVVILARPILSLLTNFEIFSQYSNYKITYNDIGVGAIAFKLPIIVIILMNLKKLKHNNAISVLAILYFVGVIFDFFSYLADYAGRIAIYFEMMQVFVVAAIIKVQKNKYERFFFTFIVIIYYLAMYTYEFIINNGHKTIPYMWVP